MDMPTVTTDWEAYRTKVATAKIAELQDSHKDFGIMIESLSRDVSNKPMNLISRKRIRDKLTSLERAKTIVWAEIMSRTKKSLGLRRK